MYLYYAVFTTVDDQFSISFPDLDGAFSSASNMSEAIYMAHDLLEGWLIVAEKEGDPIPSASNYSDIKAGEKGLIVPIQVDLELAKKKHANTLVKKL